MRRLERVFDNTYDAFDGVEKCGAQVATEMPQFAPTPTWTGSLPLTANRKANLSTGTKGMRSAMQCGVGGTDAPSRHRGSCYPLHQSPRSHQTP